MLRNPDTNNTRKPKGLEGDVEEMVSPEPSETAGTVAATGLLSRGAAVEHLGHCQRSSVDAGGVRDKCITLCLLLVLSWRVHPVG